MNALWTLAQTSMTGAGASGAGAGPGGGGSNVAGASGNIFSPAYWFGSAGASKQALETEGLFMYILWVNIVAFVILMVLMFYFVFKFRRSRQADNYQVSASHNTPLELAWSIIPLLVMVPIFYYGFTFYISKMAAPSDAEVINIYGQKWNWRAVYRNGAEPADQVSLTDVEYTVPEIIVPAGRPVKLIMTSDDVLHSFFIPDFRTKFDVIPNRYTSMWFLPEDRPNATYEVFCAEYCGEKHSEMAAQIRVVPVEEFEQKIVEWVSGPPSGVTLAEYGQIVARRKGCLACHTTDGTPSTGPTWRNHYGKDVQYADGSTHPVDEQSLSENILNSQRSIVQGFPTTMPVYVGQIKPLELQALVQFIKTLSDKANPTDIDAKEAEFRRQQEEGAAAGGGQ